MDKHSAIIAIGLLLAALVVLSWRWCGTALSPAADIGRELKRKDVVAKGGAAADSTTGTFAGSSDATEGPIVVGTRSFEPVATGTVGATYMYNGAPLFETVTARAFALEVAVAFLGGLLIGDVSALLRRVEYSVAEAPLPWSALATLCLIVALVLGAYRQLFRLLLAKAGALPALDDRGRPRFIYIGDVPPQVWCYSPWYRAGTWTIVAGTSLMAAIVMSVAIAPRLNVSVEFAAFVCLVLRWLITWVPLRLMLWKRSPTRVRHEHHP